MCTLCSAALYRDLSSYGKASSEFGSNAMVSAFCSANLAVLSGSTN